MIENFFIWENLLPRLIAVGVILAVLLLRRILARTVMRLLFVRLHRRNPERYDHVRTALIRPVSAMLLAGTLRAVLGLFHLPVSCQGVTANVLSTLFLLSAFWTLYVAAGLSAGLLMDASRDPSKKMDANAANYISIAIRTSVLIIGIFAVLSRWVTDISGLVTGLGIGGLAIALAAQDTASNLFGSIAIMLDKPFEIGDWIEVDGLSGTVISVGLRSSQIRAQDQSTVSIPNTKLANSVISNGTKRLSRRVTFRIGLHNATSPEAITAFVEGVRTILHGDAEVEPEGVQVAFDNITAAALEVYVCYFTMADFNAMLAVRQRINLAILSLTKEMDATLAYPSVSLIQEGTNG